MKKTFFFLFVFGAAFALSITMLSATPEIQQHHLKEMGDMEGGCAFCHNQKTKILQKEGSKQGFLKNQKNYKKLGTFAGCKDCHTTSGTIIKK